MSSWNAIFTAISIILIVGIMAPIFTNAFGTPDYNQSTLADSVTDFVDDGVTLNIGQNSTFVPDTIKLNPLGILGNETQNTLGNYTNSFNILPPNVQIGLFIIILIGLIVGIIKLMPTT